MAYNPEIIIHEVRSGFTFGDFTDGTQEPLVEGPPYYNGRVQFFGQGTQGGLITTNERTGTFINQITFDGAGTTRFAVFIRNNIYPSAAPVSSDVTLFSERGFHYLQSSLAAATPESWVFVPDRPIFIPPGYSVGLTTVGTLTSDGRVTFMVGGSWGYRMLQQT